VSRQLTRMFDDLTPLSVLDMPRALCRVGCGVGFEVAFAFHSALTLESLCMAVQGHFKFTQNQRLGEPNGMEEHQTG
jgi:hypothetical protein